MIKEVDKRILKKLYKKRKENSKKDDFGRLLIIGGNEKYSGSPALNSLSALQAMSAYKSGTDIVEVIAVKRAADIIASFSPDIITFPVSGKYLKKKHYKILKKESKNKTAFVIGGGLGRKNQTLELVRKFLKKTKIPGVIDADAIYALENKNSKKGIDLSKFVITPHSYEFSILTGKKPSANLHIRIKEVENQADKLNTTIILKGHQDIISNGKQTMINKTGNPYMTVGGTGDTLAGICGSLISQKNNLFESALASSYINGKAGEMTGKKASLTATDLLQEIGKIVDNV